MFMMLLGNMYLHKVSLKSFNCTDCSYVFKDGLYCLIYKASEIFLMNLLLWQLESIILKSFMSTVLWLLFKAILSRWDCLSLPQ